MAYSRPSFRDPILQKKFERKGYVVIPLLSKEEVTYLGSLPQRLNHSHDNEFFTTTWLVDTASRMETHQFLKDKLSPVLDTVLFDYRYHYGNFFIKKPGHNSECGVHQDWTMVNEPNFTALTVWCALVDMTKKNGCLKVLKGSHTIKNFIRARNSYNYLEPLSGFIYKNLMHDVPMKAGEAVIFNQRLIHGSGNNLSAENRIACGIAAVPEESKIIHYAAENGNRGALRLLDAENDFYSRYHTFDSLGEEEAVSYVNVKEEYMGKKELLTRYLTDWVWR